MGISLWSMPWILKYFKNILLILNSFKSLKTLFYLFGMLGFVDLEYVNDQWLKEGFTYCSVSYWPSIDKL